MTEIIRTGDYVLHASIKPVAHLPGSFHVAFESQVLTAKQPEERRTAFSFTGGGESLRALGRVIRGTVGE